MRRSAVHLLMAAALFVPACAEPPAGAPTPAPSPSASPSAPARGLLRPDPDASPPAEIVIGGPEGIHVVATSGDVRRFLDTPVSIAVDDTLGGVVYQEHRGEEYAVPPIPPTDLRWLQAGSSEPATLAAAGEGETLSLHDVVRSAPGVGVWFSRGQGSNPEDTLEMLVRLDPLTGSSDEVRRVGAWEYGSDPISVTPTLIAATFFAEGLTGFEFFDHEGREVELGGNPMPEPVVVGADSDRLAELSPDARILAYVHMGPDDQGFRIIPELVLVDAHSGEELHRLRLDRPDQGWGPLSLDLGDDVVVVNRRVTGAYDAAIDRAWVIDLRGSEPVVWEAPLPGRAHLIRTPMEFP